MRIAIIFSLVLTSIGLLTASVVGHDMHDASETQLLVEIELFAQETPHVRKKVLSNPTVAITVGRPFEFHVGGKLPSNHGGDDLLIGTKIRGRVERATDDQYRLSISISSGSEVQYSAEDADVVRTETLDVRTKMCIEKLKRFRYSECAWCTIELQSAPATDGTRTSP